MESTEAIIAAKGRKNDLRLISESIVKYDESDKIHNEKTDKTITCPIIITGFGILLPEFMSCQKLFKP